MSRRKKDPSSLLPAAVHGVVQPSVSSAPTIAPIGTPAVDRLGLVLRAARETKGLTLVECEQQLRIKEEYLLALENGHYPQLPTATHAKGFLRTYAVFLGLESQLADLQARFAAETTALPAAPQLHMPQPLPEAHPPARRFMIGGVIAAVVVYVLYLWLAADPAPPAAKQELAPPAAASPSMSEAIAPPAVAAAQTDISATAPAALVVDVPPTVPAPTTMPAVEKPPEQKVEALSPAPAPVLEPVIVPAGPPADVTIKALAESWIHIQDAMGATIYSRLLRTGETYTPANTPGLSLTVGNGAGVVLVRDGRDSAPLGKSAEVVRDIPLTAPAAKKKATER
jgi:cytoskeleton protein RodZ